jgi:hypothetical protein
MLLSRRIIQIATSQTDTTAQGRDRLWALCTDGTIWVFHAYGVWEQMPRIPQDDPK